AGVGTAGSRRSLRFLAGGAAQAAPVAAFDYFTDADRNDIMLNVIPQFFLGGVLGAIGPSEHALKVDAAARRAMKATEFDIVREQAAKNGRAPGDVLTDKGKVYFSEQLRGETEGFFRDLQQRLRQTLVDTAPTGLGDVEG